MLYRLIHGHGVTFFTLGIQHTVRTETIERKNDVFTSLALLPHAYIFMLNMLICIFLANSEINSRVAFTQPYYFLAFS